MGSFIPSGALYKYLLSAPGVPSAGLGATGVRRKESRLALPSPHWQSERDPWDSDRGGRSWGSVDGALVCEGSPKEGLASLLDALFPDTPL